MNLRHTEATLDKQLRAEVRRILQLLERTRRTRQQVRLLIALETRTTRPTCYRATLPGGGKKARTR